MGFPVVQVTPIAHQSQSRDRRSRCQGALRRDYTIISAYLCFSVTIVFSQVHCVPYIFHCIPYLFVSGMLRYCSTTQSGGLWYQWGGNWGRDLQSDILKPMKSNLCYHKEKDEHVFAYIDALLSSSA